MATPCLFVILFELFEQDCEFVLQNLVVFALIPPDSENCVTLNKFLDNHPKVVLIIHYAFEKNQVLEIGWIAGQGWGNPCFASNQLGRRSISSWIYPEFDTRLEPSEPIAKGHRE